MLLLCSYNNITELSENFPSCSFVVKFIVQITSISILGVPEREKKKSNIFDLFTDSCHPTVK